MSRRKTSSVPVGAMVAALAVIAVAALFALFVGSKVLTVAPSNSPPAQSGDENR